MTIPDNTPRACPSCGELFSGTYCNHCGEQVLDPGKLTLRYFLGHTVVSELLSLDGRIWRSLRLLMLRPGFLAAEYALGRRRPYVNALRILLITIVIFAVTMTGANSTLSVPVGDFTLRLNTIPSPMFWDSSLEGALFRTDPYGVIENMLEQKVGVPVAAIPTEASDRFKEVLISLATPLSFTVVVLLGMLLYLLFNRKRPLFVDHLVFAMHYYSFLLITAMVSALVFRIVGRHLSITIILLALFAFGLWRFVYLTIAIRRFYFSGEYGLMWLTSMGVSFLLLICNAVFITAIQMACGAVAVWVL